MTKPDKNSIEERRKVACPCCGAPWLAFSYVDEETGEVKVEPGHTKDPKLICNRYRPVEAPVGVGAAELAEQSKARWGVADGRAMARGEGLKNE